MNSAISPEGVQTNGNLEDCNSPTGRWSLNQTLKDDGRCSWRFGVGIPILNTYRVPILGNQKEGKKLQ